VIAQRVIAAIGVAGVLAVALAASIGINLWQWRNAGRAAAECEQRITAMQMAAIDAAARRDDVARDVARRLRADAEARIDALQTAQTEVRTRVQTITRTIPVPVGCPTSLPDSVRDALADAADAANR